MPRKLLTPLLIVVSVACFSLSFADDSLPAKERLKSCDPRVALSAAKEILNDPKTLQEPLEMFSPALILFQSGEKDDAVFWFYVAQLRVRYQLAFQKGDRGQLLQVMLMTVGPPINNYAFQDVLKLDRQLDRVLEWDRATPNSMKEGTRADDNNAQIEKIYSGFRDLRTKLRVEKDDIEQKAKAAAPQIEQMYSQMRSRPCQPGFPDPAYANRTIEMEKNAVAEFTKDHKDVLQEVGAIKYVNVSSYRLNPQSTLPSRYTVSVDGTNKRLFAEVEVSRSGDRAHFVLVCTTSLSLGQRDPFKDICVQ
ncbi:hypothetical protein [Ferribacterium limneticum]|uniref:hypothetical protein n=1 Tax=Ferribacterium limneticum TaxID=76259 RepID=UPI001CF87C3F|nr:hypothetical protein [Ferribacterium limneticum]UCV24164.1 hypothetical protein KI613_06490 [Ferribacterium limneticum]